MSWWFGKHPFAGPISQDMFADALNFGGAFFGDPLLGEQLVGVGTAYQNARYKGGSYADLFASLKGVGGSSPASGGSTYAYGGGTSFRGALAGSIAALFAGGGYSGRDVV